MSKETKFLSIAIGLLQGKIKDEGADDAIVSEMEASRLLTLMEYVLSHYKIEGSKRENEVDIPGSNDRNRFHQNGIVDINGPLGSVYIETLSEGVGVPAQVKFFKLRPGEAPKSFDRVNGKITMIRDITGIDGCLSRKLTPGRYVVEISKGSEYEIITDYIEVEADKYEKRQYELNHFIDLSEEGWIAGDLHHHSIYSSPVFGGDDDVVDSPKEVANSMMAMGLRFGALSDHHNVLNHRSWQAMKRDDFTPLISKEISTSNGHVMALGVDKDIIYNIPDDEHRTDDYLRSEFVRITDDIKESGGLAQINHPRDLQRSISWNPDFDDMLDIFDTMEIWNGSAPMMPGSTDYAAYELWCDCLKRGLFIPATTGSDTHNIAANDYHILFDRIIDSYDLIKKNEEELREKYPEEIYVFNLICEQILPILEKWAETCLTSGGVRTYIYAGDNREQLDIIKVLKAGNSFLTNGPILIPKVNGKLPGEHLSGEKELSIDIRLFSNRELTKLQVLSEKGLLKEIDLEAGKENGFYDYSQKIELTINDDHFVYFIAQSDCTNLAITNPVICD